MLKGVWHYAFFSVLNCSISSLVNKFHFFCISFVFIPDEDELLIERSAHTGMINPGDHWQTVLHDGPVARLGYRIRVRCDENYYGNKCKKLCVPRDDYFGHYRCDPSGAQVCLGGWMGPDCRTGEQSQFDVVVYITSLQKTDTVCLCVYSTMGSCITEHGRAPAKATLLPLNLTHNVTDGW